MTSGCKLTEKIYDFEKLRENQKLPDQFEIIEKIFYKTGVDEYI